MSSWLNPIDKAARRYPQADRESKHCRHTGHPVAALDVRDERRMQPGCLGQLFLRLAALGPKLAHPCSEGLGDGQVAGSVPACHEGI